MIIESAERFAAQLRARAGGAWSRPLDLRCRAPGFRGGAAALETFRATVDGFELVSSCAAGRSSGNPAGGHPRLVDLTSASGSRQRAATPALW